MGTAVLTLGTFDLFHAGHVHLLKQCRRISGGHAVSAGKVVVAVNPDEFVEQFKGRRPIQTFAERTALVKACRYVDQVEATPGADAKPLIDQIKPAWIVIGKDWATRDYHAQLQVTPEYLERIGCAILYIDRVGDLSSTKLKERVRAS